ncbi:MAG TPA: hypothetical protein VM052_07125 [Candidatus Limnocylindrales bacterium]|nr:hypothetical protein [Candidatus Limnocylindrales bacterium]
MIGTVTNTPFATTAPSAPGVAEQASACVYQGTSGLLTIAVALKAFTRSDLDTIAKQVPGMQSIPGIGDAAYGTASGAGSVSGATLFALKGTSYLSLSATGSKTADAMLASLKTIATSAVAKL